MFVIFVTLHFIPAAGHAPVT